MYTMRLTPCQFLALENRILFDIAEAKANPHRLSMNIAGDLNVLPRGPPKLRRGNCTNAALSTTFFDFQLSETELATFNLSQPADAQGLSALMRHEYTEMYCHSDMPRALIHAAP